MSQTWSAAQGTIDVLESSDLLSDSRTDLNNALDALKTNFYGSSDPGVHILSDGLLFINSTTNKLKGREGGATFEVGDWGTSNLGHIRKDGTIAFTSNQSMGGNRLTNLVTTTEGSASNDASSKGYVDTKISKSSATDSHRTMTNFLFLETTTPGTPRAPTADSHATNKLYVDTKVSKSGGDVITGQLKYSSSIGNLDPNSAPFDTHTLIGKAHLRVFRGFSTTSTGHNHDGSNSAQTKLSSQLAGSNQTYRLLRPDGAAGVAWEINGDSLSTHELLFTQSGVQTSAQLENVSAFLPSYASWALLRFIFTGNLLLHIRKATGNEAVVLGLNNVNSDDNLYSIHMAKLDMPGQTFDWWTPVGTGQVICYLAGFF